MERKFDIIICGVGGQGIILCSNLIGYASLIEGYPVKGCELHGMAQRGGSVESHIRINCNFGPKIPIGNADLIIGFEPLETLRCSHYIKKNGIIVANSYPIYISGKKYDHNMVIEKLKEISKNLFIENFTEIALRIGSIKILNIVMLGYAHRFIPLEKESFIKGLNEILPKKFLEINLKGFNYFT